MLKSFKSLTSWQAPGTRKAVLTNPIRAHPACCRDVTHCAAKTVCETLSNISQIDCPTPHIHTEYIHLRVGL